MNPCVSNNPPHFGDLKLLDGWDSSLKVFLNTRGEVDGCTYNRKLTHINHRYIQLNLFSFAISRSRSHHTIQTISQYNTRTRKSRCWVALPQLISRRRCWFSSFSSSTWCGIGESHGAMEDAPPNRWWFSYISWNWLLAGVVHSINGGMDVLRSGMTRFITLCFPHLPSDQFTLWKSINDLNSKLIAFKIRVILGGELTHPLTMNVGSSPP